MAETADNARALRETTPLVETYAPAREAVGLASGSKQVSVGLLHACALTTAGAIKCWGGNGTGALGNGEDDNGGTARQDQPVAVLSLP